CVFRTRGRAGADLYVGAAARGHVLRGAVAGTTGGAAVDRCRDRRTLPLSIGGGGDPRRRRGGAGPARTGAMRVSGRRVLAGVGREALPGRAMAGITGPIRATLLLAALLMGAACAVSPPISPLPGPLPPAPQPVEPPALELRYLSAQWTEMPGWQQDDLAAAWPALLASCGSARMPAAWQAFCSQARAMDRADVIAQRALVESRLRPWRVVLESSDGAVAAVRQDTGLVTGYYEPVLN